MCTPVLSQHCCTTSYRSVYVLYFIYHVPLSKKDSFIRAFQGGIYMTVLLDFSPNPSVVSTSSFGLHFLMP